MSNSDPNIDIQTDTSANTSHHSLRKRHSPNVSSSVKKEETSLTSGSASKLRKTSNTTVASDFGPHGEEVDKPSSSRHQIPNLASRQPNELKYLTDFFPDQPGECRLTRSRAKSFVPGKTTEEGPTSSRSLIPILSKDRIVKKTRKHELAKVASSASGHVDEHKSGPSRLSATRSSPASDALSTQSFGIMQYPNDDVFMQSAPGSSSQSVPVISHTDVVGSPFQLGIPHSMLMGISQGAQRSFTNFPNVAAAMMDIPGSSTAYTGSTNNKPSASNPKTGTSSNLTKSQHVHRASAFLGSLVPRMQHLLSSSIGSSNNSGSNSSSSGSHMHSNIRIMSIIEGLRSSNEIRQSEAASELAEMLLLGNEETLPNMPIREIIHALMNLLQKDHNFELMLTATRCITNMQEALPRALPVIVEAIPLLLQKLKRIEYIEVAEQSLIALEVMSRRNAKNILSAGGICSTILHVDFFSLPSQRLAFQIAANCASFITANNFVLIRECLGDLTQRLTVDDKRCVESICTFFCRIIENIRYNAERIREIAGSNYELLKNFQQLLTIQPSTISSNTFLSLLKSIRYMCAKCGDIAVALIKMDFGRTIRYLLGSDKKDDVSIDLTGRSPLQVRELVELTGELMPNFPKNEIFEINVPLQQYMGIVNLGSLSRRYAYDLVTVGWYWLNELEEWQQFGSAESNILEQARQVGPHAEVVLDINGETFEVDLTRMVKKNSTTNAEYRIERRFTSVPNMHATKETEAVEVDERQSLKELNSEILTELVTLLFPFLVEVGCSSTCSSMRYDSLRVMNRMISAVDNEENLKSILCNVPLASYISSTLSSNKSPGVIISALQLIHIVLEKLPNLYVPLFDQEGVFHEVKRIATTKPTTSGSEQSPSKSIPETKPSSSSRRRYANSGASTIGLSQTSANTISSHYDEAFLQRILQRTSSSAAEALLVGDRNYNPHQGVNISSSLNSAFSSPDFLLSHTQPNLSSLPSFMPTVSGTQSNSLMFPLGGSNALESAMAALTSSVGSLSNPSSMTSIVNQMASASSMRHAISEKLHAWIVKESEYILANYTGEMGAVYGTESNVDILEELSLIASLLQTKSKDVGTSPLNSLKQIFLDREISAFQLNHSGLPAALNVYLTDTEQLMPPRKLRLKRFAAIFLMLSSENLRPLAQPELFASFERLVSKTVLAASQLEQFTVKLTNLGGILSGSSGSGSISSASFLRGAQALRFFQSHQIRCILKRHPNCKQLREWRHGRGSIKVDPFTSISAIERYLVDRGIGITAQDDDSSDNADISDEDQDLSFTSSTAFNGRIEILIGDQRLPSDISILQAIRQYSLPHEDDDQESIPSSIWITSHVLYYRASDQSSSEVTPGSSRSATTTTGLVTTVPAPPLKKIPRMQRASTPKKEKRISKNTNSVFQDGQPPKPPCPLEKYLKSTLDVEMDDPSVGCLVFLKTLYGLNNYWWCLFDEEEVPPTSYAPILPQGCFHSTKLNSKVSRQLSDFLCVATQQIPRWTSDLVRAVPFCFPFSTRRNLLYCTAFGRDRALMHLVNEGNGDEADGESTSRSFPRLERRKVSINRQNLLKEAQNTMSALSNSKAILEVGFEGEAGTGFGPTLEFYSALSRELQKHSLKLWYGKPQKMDEERCGSGEEFTTCDNGLYPSIVRQASTKQLESRYRKFEFIGRLLAQALLDSRMLDLPISPIFFKWLLHEESSLGIHDLETLEPTLYRSLRQLALTDSADFDDLEQYFTLPGDETFELMKGGKNTQVEKHKAKQFIDLVCYWRLFEGVRIEMESVRKGFESVINSEHLRIFAPEEMEELFCGCAENGQEEKIWSRTALQQAIRPDHGYTHDSAQIGWLIDMLHSYSKEKRRKFLQFVTGSPRLPVGGFRALNPPLTVVRKTASYGNSENELPSAMTCYNYLKIPPYETFEMFVERFNVALQFIYSFYLT